MAQVTRVNGGVAAPVTKSANQMLNGDLTHIRVNFNSIDVSGKFGVGGAVEYATKLIMNQGLTIVAIGTAQNSDATADGVRMSLEGVFGTDTYDGSVSESIAAHLEDVLQADGSTVDGVDFSGATVDAFTF